MSFNLDKLKDPQSLYLLPTAWFLEYNKDEGIFCLYDQGGFTPTHEQLLSIIQELCNSYDVVSENDIFEYNNSRRQKFRIEPDLKPPTPKPTRTPLKGFVYLIQHGETNLYKVGMSIDPLKRLNQLQASNPESLKLISTIATDDMVTLEAYFHKLFEEDRHTREWFRLSAIQIEQFMNHNPEAESIAEPDINEDDFF